MSIATRTFLAAAVAVLSTTAATGAQSADQYWSLLPEHTVACVVVNDLAATDAAVGKLARLAGVPHQRSVFDVLTLLGVQQGLDRQGNAALVLAGENFPAERPVALLFLPVTDYQKFIAPLMPEKVGDSLVQLRVGNLQLLSGRFGKWAVLTELRNKELLQELLADSPSTTEVPKSLRQFATQFDVAVVVPQPAVKRLCGLAQGGIARVREQIKHLQPDNAGADGLRMYEHLFAALGRHLQGAAVGVQFDDEKAVHVASRLLFAPGVLPTAESVLGPGKVKDVLGRMPSEQFLVAMAVSCGPKLGEAMAKLSILAMQSMPKIYAASEQKQQELAAAAAASMKQMKSMAMVMAVPEVGSPMLDKTFFLLKTSNAEAYLRLYAESIEQSAAIIERSNLPMVPKMTVEKMELDGKPALRVTLKYEWRGIDDPQQREQMEQFFSTAFGPGGKLSITLAAIDEQTVAGCYAGETALRRAVGQLGNGQNTIARQTELAELVDRLPDDAVFAALVDVGGFFNFVRYVATTVRPMPPGRFPRFDIVAPFSASASLGENTLDGQLLVPHQTISRVAEAVARARSSPPELR